METASRGKGNIAVTTNMKIKLNLILVILLCLGACAPGHNDYSHFVDISDEGWKYGDTLKFDIETQDSISTGELTIALRHTNAYPYSNLWLEIRHFNGDSTRIDTVNIEMADMYGRWHGDGIGSSFQYALPVSKKITIYKGKPISISHIMRVEHLPAIEQVGLIFDGIEIDSTEIK